MNAPRPTWPQALRLCGLLSIAVLAACQDSAPTAPGTSPQFDISEARFGMGNPDFFFSSPLASGPAPGDTGFEPGAANGALVPYLRVCTTDGAESPAGCLVDVTDDITRSSTGLAMTFDPASELYQVQFRTRRFEDDPDLDVEYRIEIWGVEFTDRSAVAGDVYPAGHPLAGQPRWLFGWRDLDNSPSSASCTGLEEFCLINYGQTIPVKVRIEDSVFCPVARDCEVQFVASGEEANLVAVFDGNGPAGPASLFQDPSPAAWAELNFAAQEAGFAIAFGPCSDADIAKAFAFAGNQIFRRPCAKTTGIEEIEALFTISFCLQVNPAVIAAQLNVPDDQLELVTVHHFDQGGDATGPVQQMQVLPEAFPICIEPPALADSRSGLLRLAQSAGKRVRSLFGPQPLVALDRGGGGRGDKANSIFTLGLPGKLDYLTPADQFQTGAAGSQITLQARVLAADVLPAGTANPMWVADGTGTPEWGADPTWSVDPSSPTGGSTLVSTTGYMNGVTEATFSLPSEGTYVFNVAGNGLADPRESGCTLFDGSSVACNGPLPPPAYDPFQPGGILTLPLDTYLPFTVSVCGPGRGTVTMANHDGILGPDWACAVEIPIEVNLSGGSTVDATLFAMNDDDRLYLAVEVPGVRNRNALRFEFDSNGDAPDGTNDGPVGERAPGDDVWGFDPQGGPADQFIGEKCSGTSQSGCADDDEDFGGFNDTWGGFSNSAQEGFTVYELSHPLGPPTGGVVDQCVEQNRRQDCGSVGAIDLNAGGVVSVFGEITVGSGATGNTQFPGFRQYMKIVIH